MKRVLSFVIAFFVLISITIAVYAADFSSASNAVRLQEYGVATQSFSGNAMDYDGWFSFTAYTPGNYKFTFSVSSYPYDNYLEVQAYSPLYSWKNSGYGKTVSVSLEMGSYETCYFWVSNTQRFEPFSVSGKVEKEPCRNHDWDSGRTVSQAACKDEGMIEYTCEICGETDYEYTEKSTTHNYTRRALTQYIKTAATCQKAAVYYESCSICGVINYDATFTSGSADSSKHIYSNDCDTTCDACGKTRTAIHSYSNSWQSNGTMHWKECSGCGAKKNEQNCTGGNATCKEKAICTTCNKAYGNLAQHSFVENAEEKYLKTSATCSAAAEYYKSCSVCAIASDKLTFNFGSSDASKHIYDHSCDPNCNQCGANRSITHTWKATYSFDSTNHWTECSVCEAKKDQVQHSGGTADCVNQALCNDCMQPYGELANCISMLEKAEVKYLVSAATCKDAAVYYNSCAVCGKAGENTFTNGIVDANNHVETELRNQTSVSCTTDGYTGDTYCKGCGEKIAAGSAIPAAHNLNKIAANPATHDAAGNIEHYACAVCEKLYKDNKATTELTKAEIVIAKDEHSYSETFKSDENGHWKDCECGSKIEEGAHTYGEWVTTKKADVEVEGSKERTCAVCGYKQTETIPAITNPATGDDTQLGLLLVMMLISACGVGAVLFLGTQKKGKYSH